MSRYFGSLCNKKEGISCHVAVPSFILPATVAENCRFLSTRFSEIGLYFLELQACLDYGPQDLPETGAGMRYHVHLPLDLPWERGSDAVFLAISRLYDKIVHLSPWGFVLHPPQGLAPMAAARALAGLARRWREAGLSTRDILLENVEGAGAEHLFPVAEDLDFSLCLDLGHMLAYSQEDVLSLPDVFARTRMLHIYAPYDLARPGDRELVGRGHRHRALGALDQAGRGLLKIMLDGVREETALVMEVFSERDLSDSLEAFEALQRERRGLL